MQQEGCRKRDRHFDVMGCVRTIIGYENRKDKPTADIPGRDKFKREIGGGWRRGWIPMKAGKVGQGFRGPIPNQDEGLPVRLEEDITYMF